MTSAHAAGGLILQEGLTTFWGRGARNGRPAAVRGYVDMMVIVW